MAAQNFDFFRFYEDYLWLHTNFDAFQDAVKDYSEAGFRGAFESKVLKGLGFGGSVVYELTVEQGIAINPSGIPMVLTSDESATPSETPDVSNDVYSLVVLRPKIELINLIDEPLNPTNQVPLNERQTAEVVVIDGTPATPGSAVYPSKGGGDVILFGLKMPAGTSSITSDMVDYTVGDFIRPNQELLKSLSVYDAIVSKEREGTHKTLEELAADGNLGSSIRKVIVLESQSLSSEVTFTAGEFELEFKKGVSVQKDSAATGLIFEGNGVLVKNGRFIDFDGASDHAIVWRGEYGHSLMNRFKDCQNELTDESVNGIIQIGTYTEA